MAQEVYILEKFSDKDLLTNSIGESIVKLYHKYSPSIADLCIVSAIKWDSQKCIYCKPITSAPQLQVTAMDQHF